MAGLLELWLEVLVKGVDEDRPDYHPGGRPDLVVVPLAGHAVHPQLPERARGLFGTRQHPSVSGVCPLVLCLPLCAHCPCAANLLPTCCVLRVLLRALVAAAARSAALPLATVGGVGAGGTFAEASRARGRIHRSGSGQCGAEEPKTASVASVIPSTCAVAWQL